MPSVPAILTELLFFPVEYNQRNAVKTFEEFVAAIFPIAKHSLENLGKDRSSRYDETKWSVVSNAEQVTHKTRLVGPKVSTGGVHGGSCWDNSDPRPYSSSYEDPEIPELDTILETVCPKLTFLAYKRLMREVEIERLGETVHEYYGNYTEYVYKAVKVGKLYETLVAMELL